MRPSSWIFALWGLFALVYAALVTLAYIPGPISQDSLQAKAMVNSLGLTDLSLFTEARYTRHLSQSDLHSAFQDHPLSFEHFPSGSFFLPDKNAFSKQSGRWNKHEKLVVR